ncbi:MAG: hypothetical protein AB3N33_07545 [Puniceicoccaceae bacterium]
MNPVLTYGLILMGLFGPVLLYAGLERVAVPITRDRAFAYSGMAFEIDRMVFDNLRLDDPRISQLGPDVQGFFSLVQALDTQSLDAVMELVQLQPHENPEKRRAYVQACQEAFAGKWQGMELLARYKVGGLSTFVFNVPMDNGNYVTSFRIGGSPGAYRWDDSTEAEFLMNLDNLVAAGERLKREGQVPPDLSGEFRYKSRIPGADFDVLFNGTVLDWSIASDIVPDIPVVQFYAEAQQAFIDKDIAGYVEYFTPGSREKLVEWLGNMPEEELASYYTSFAGEKRVVFILDADPFYIFHYLIGNTLDYDTVWNDGERFWMTNVGVHFFLDRLLRDRIHFIEPVLSSVLEAGPDDLVYVASEEATPPPSAVPSAVVQPTAPTPDADLPVLPEAPSSETPEEEPDNSRRFFFLLVVIVAVLITTRQVTKRS